MGVIGRFKTKTKSGTNYLQQTTDGHSTLEIESAQRADSCWQIAKRFFMEKLRKDIGLRFSDFGPING